MLKLLVTANVVPRLPILVILIMEATHSYETLVIIRVTRRNIPEDGILHSHHRENLKSYISFKPLLSDLHILLFATSSV
jgi:hypothetical protein